MTLTLVDLSIGYREGNQVKKLSSALNVTMKSGTLICLVGKNGVGKSTLLRTLSGFQPALEGDMLLDGKAMLSFDRRKMSETVSVVLTEHSAIQDMNVAEIVAMGRMPYTNFWGTLRREDKKIVAEAIESVGMTAFTNRPMTRLSDGERQKVMIAKAIAQETPIIFLDEPTAYLDYPSKIQMMLLLHRLAKALKKTIFMSTHDLEHALQVADQVWLLDQREGLTTGLPEDLSIDGSIERYFARDGLLFDRESCSFSIEHETAREVYVEGKEGTLEYNLCCKALIRNGIKPSAEKGNVGVRIPGDGTYRLMEKGQESIKVEKIGYLLHMIVPTITKYQISAIREAADMNQYE